VPAPARSPEDYGDWDDVAVWAKPSAKECVEGNLILGFDALLKPKSEITRAEAAAVLTRLLLRP
jgi:hypothetical protein